MTDENANEALPSDVEPKYEQPAPPAPVVLEQPKQSLWSKAYTGFMDLPLPIKVIAGIIVLAVVGNVLTALFGA